MATSPKEKRDEEQIAKAMARPRKEYCNVSDIPYVGSTDFRGRVFHMHGYYDQTEGWYVWIHRDEKIIPIVGIPCDGAYYSSSPEDPDDYLFTFGEFIHQQASWRKPSWLTDGMFSDIKNLGASLAKLRLINAGDHQQVQPARMGATELEYIFLVCRSLLDLLQETVAELWTHIDFTDPNLKKRDLPPSFAKMVLSGESSLNADQIAEKWKLPKAWADAYETQIAFFDWLRAYRDRLAHSGESFSLVFSGERGLGISITDEPFCRMPIWTANNTGPNSVGSFKSAACYVISKTLQTIEHFADLLKRSILWPPAIAPKHRLYLRAPHLGEIVRVQEGIDADAWYKPVTETTAVGAPQ